MQVSKISLLYLIDDFDTCLVRLGNFFSKQEGALQYPVSKTHEECGGAKLQCCSTSPR